MPADEGSIRVAESDPLVGTEIQGRYRILKRLGAGGMGVVYLGEHSLIRRKVAIKTLHAFYATEASVVERFHREALAATSIGNEHIVEVTDMGHLPGGAMFMVLEYLEGNDLGHYLESEGPQPLGRVVHILLQMCEALTAVHAQGIVHRDLKPENVFLIKRGDNPDFVKLLDFGISKFKQGFGDREAKMTATGAMLGTPFFMAPEQAQGVPDIDHRVDVYALGAILYYTLSGRHPFEAENLPQLFIKICTEDPPRLGTLRPELPPEIEGIVHRALARSRADRYQSAEELRQALLPFATLDRAALSRPMPSSAGEPAAVSSPAAVPARTADPTPASTPGAPSPITSGSLGGAAKSVIAQPATRRSRKLFVLSAVAGLAAVGTGGVWLALQKRAPAIVVPEPAASPSVQAPSDLGVAAVRVSVDTDPPGAELFLDGNRIANPFDAELPKTAEPRVLEAQLRGYPTVRQELVLMYPQRVRLSLRSNAPQAEPSAPAARLGPARSRAAPGREEPSKAPAREVATEATPPSAPAPPAPPPAQPPQAPAAAPAARATTPAATATATQRTLKTPF